MSDTTIDDLLEQVFHWGVSTNSSDIIGNDKAYLNLKTHAVKTAKSALYDLILKEVVGEDKPLFPKDGGMVEAENIARSYQNTLRAEQRNKLKGLFDE